MAGYMYAQVFEEQNQAQDRRDARHRAGELLYVEVLDHLVIGQGRWVSLKERGLGFA